MAHGLRVGPNHRADTSREAAGLASDWLAEHRPVTAYDREALPYTIHVQPERGRWVAKVEATWTPTPQQRRSHERKAS